MSNPQPAASVEASSKTPPAVPMRRILAAFLLPLFFVVVFPLAYVSATHAPTPNDLRLAVVGPEQVVGKIAESLDKTSAFDVTVQTDVASDARSSVLDRKVDGAIRVTVQQPQQSAATESGSASSSGQGTTGAQQAEGRPSFSVTTYVGSGAGRATASTVEAAASEIADQLGTTAKTVDVAPLASDDALGTDLFYLLVYTSLGGYLVIIVLTQVMPTARLRTRFAAAAGAAVAAPLIVFGLSSIFVGDYGASFGTIVALLGINAIYVFTVASLAILVQQFLGNAATFGVMAFVVFLNFPSAGGATPAALMPSFWQGVHSVYFGAGAFESFRSLIYFDGHGLARWFLQLLAWTGGLALAIGVVHLWKANRRQRHELDDLRKPQHRHLQVQSPRQAGDDRQAQQSITTGSEATA